MAKCKKKERESISTARGSNCACAADATVFGPNASGSLSTTVRLSSHCECVFDIKHSFAHRQKLSSVSSQDSCICVCLCSINCALKIRVYFEFQLS